MNRSQGQEAFSPNPPTTQTSPLAKAVAQVLALVYTNIPTVNLSRFFRGHACVGFGLSKPPTETALNTALVNLLEAGILDHQGYWVRIVPEQAHALCMEVVASKRIDFMLNVIRDVIPLPMYVTSLHMLGDASMAVREARISLYQERFDAANGWIERIIDEVTPADWVDNFLRSIFFNPFDLPWLLRMPFSTLIRPLEWFIDYSERCMVFHPEVSVLVDGLLARDHQQAFPSLYRLAARLAYAQGEPSKVLTLAASAGDKALEVTALARFQQGFYAPACQSFEELLKQEKKRTKKRIIRLPLSAELAYLLSLKALGTPEHLTTGKQYLDQIFPSLSTPADFLIIRMMRVVYDQLDLATFLHEQEAPTWPSSGGGQLGPLTLLLYHMVLYQQDRRLTTEQQKLLLRLEAHLKERGEHWLESECAELLGQFTGDEATLIRASQLRASGGCVSMMTILRRIETWDRVLSTLASMMETTEERPEPATRLLWMLTLNDHVLTLSLKEQRSQAGGSWTQGRHVSVRRVIIDFDPNAATACLADQRVLEKMAALPLPSEVDYVIQDDRKDVLLALIGHPNVVWSHTPTQPVTLVQRVPELKVSRGRKDIRLQLTPFHDSPSVKVSISEENRMEIITLSQAQVKIARLVGKTGLVLPASASTRAREVLASMTSLLPVDIRVLEAELDPVEASSLPVVLLVPRGERLELSLVVRPQGPGTPAYAPGEGPERLHGTHDEKPALFVRNKYEERARADQLVAAVPYLQATGNDRGPWLLEDLEVGLNVLQTLNALGSDVALEWPKGGALNVTRDADVKNLRMRIQGQGDWFEANGRLALDDGTTLEMLVLLHLMDGARTRFIRLGADRYLALTEALRKKLESMRGLVQPGDTRVRIHPLAALSVDESLVGVGELDVDPLWQEQLKRIRTAQSLKPQVPPHFRAELRPYQYEGFCWMARLAHWGAGACLADDMGLGKTVQTLALLSMRASGGPALVLAPTSVCPNWVDEARTFAPELIPILFGPGDRTACIDQLGPNHLLICTYGLLLQEQALLTQPRWHTVILDEAQAIKNVAAKRSQAVLQLKADFRLITTGTPIENHLGELWTLFRFLNPGLLGSLEKFNARFAAPIERDRDPGAQNGLRQLLQPFILRRKKADVLSELPSRTEILVHVAPSSQEQALYEALRQRALETLADPDIPPLQKRFKILTEIMRLRRAACNARLVLPDQDIPSSKLAELEGILDELLENRHKALIFSQFVDHLDLIRALVEKKGISFQYLDGSTPQAERKRRIAAFQSGQGDVFLISLKAGGVGINLTAADYVIHMDPWWNPAVEDQASDRAHRMGQTRPVTVYRLVSRGSIEDKIVALHQRKRGLADSLLAGTDASGKLSEAELLSLLTSEGLRAEVL